MACSRLEDCVSIGGSSGTIYLIRIGGSPDSVPDVNDNQALEGHSRRVSGLAYSLDNCTLVSSSDDGSVRVWDTWTLQCTRELKPLNKCALTSILVCTKICSIFLFI